MKNKYRKGLGQEGQILAIQEKDEKIDRAAIAAAMPHRRAAGADRLDARLESTLGHLYFAGRISEGEYDAGMRYAGIALRYLKSIEAPEPYGGDARSLVDDVCYQRKVIYRQALDVLNGAGELCSIAVNRVAIYGEEPYGHEWPALRAGLRALAGEYGPRRSAKIIPFSRFMTRQ